MKEQTTQNQLWQEKHKLSVAGKVHPNVQKKKSTQYIYNYKATKEASAHCAEASFVAGPGIEPGTS